MPVIYLFIIVTPGYLMELGLLRYPYNYMNNRSLQELFPMMIEDQNINYRDSTRLRLRDSRAADSDRSF